MNSADNRENNPERNRKVSVADKQIPAGTPPAGTSRRASTQRFAVGAPRPASPGRVAGGGQSARTQRPGVGEHPTFPVYGPGEHPQQHRPSSAYADQPPSAPRRSRTAPPQPSAPPGASRQMWAALAPTEKEDEQKLSLIEKLMLRGARGELIQQPWFQSIRQENADLVVRVAFGVAILITLVLEFGMASISLTSMAFEVVVWYPLWLALGYLYIAVGTKLAHRFLLGVCVAGVLVSLSSVWGALSALSYAHSVEPWLGVPVVPVGLIIFRLLFDLAMLGLFGYLGVLVYRGTKRLGR
jgi:hypothetical protein